MSLNHVIGAGNRIPWHLPEDFKWFKQTTSGHVLIMGRKTFESIGRPLPNRLTLVLSRRQLQIPGVEVVSDLESIRMDPQRFGGRQLFICGGAEIYRQALPFCSDLYLTLVKREVEGDTFFPPFEDRFELKEKKAEREDFEILHYVSREV